MKPRLSPYLALCLLMFLAQIWTGWHYHSPVLFKFRPVLSSLSWAIGILLALGLCQKIRRTQPGRRLGYVLFCLTLLGASSFPTLQKWRFQRMKNQVLHAQPETLHRLGRHFIVGYTDNDELKTLVSHGAIGGIFVSARNIRGKNPQQVRSEIDALQSIQANLGLPPLWVATDQEGGIVSKLSPLVRTQVSLGELVKTPIPQGELPTELRSEVVEFGEAQAEDLQTLGINLNLSPVVDLRPPDAAKLGDFYTRLDRRAIAQDPNTVTLVAREYCRALRRHGIMPTLKHFPGLATVKSDTHFHLGRVDRSLDTLQNMDWRPFRDILADTPAFLMLGHVRVPQIDPEQPASLSRKLIQKVLRREWNYQGLLITDDFAMGPIYGRPGSVQSAAVQALNAGVDLLLFSYDGDLFYPAMAAVLEAEQRGKLAQGFLELSATRMKKSFRI